jgi:hypothetical protein
MCFIISLSLPSLAPTARIDAVLFDESLERIAATKVHETIMIDIWHFV